MLTIEKLTAAAQHLPAEFSLGQLVDKLLVQEEPTPRPIPTASTAGAAAQNAPEASRYTSPEAAALYAKFPVPPSLRALRGIAAELTPADVQKSAKEWEAERIQAKYSLWNGFIWIVIIQSYGRFKYAFQPFNKNNIMAYF